MVKQIFKFLNNSGKLISMDGIHQTLIEMFVGQLWRNLENLKL